MTQIAEGILKSFQELPADEQSEVVDQLCESLWKTKLKSADAENWQAFLEGRIAAADRGEFAEGTADDVIQRVRESLAKRSGMMALRFLQVAEDELTAASHWYNREKRGLGDQFLEAVVVSRRRIEADPFTLPHSEHYRGRATFGVVLWMDFLTK